MARDRRLALRFHARLDVGRGPCVPALRAPLLFVWLLGPYGPSYFLAALPGLDGISNVGGVCASLGSRVLVEFRALLEI